MNALLVASRNRKKLAELRRVLDAAGIAGLDLLSLDDVAAYDEAPETGATFEENAIAKARDGFAATGLPTLADDSGLEVAALNGMPGCCPRGGPADTVTTRPTTPWYSLNSGMCPTSAAVPRSSPPARW